MSDRDKQNVDDYWNRTPGTIFGELGRQAHEGVYNPAPYPKQAKRTNPDPIPPVGPKHPPQPELTKEQRKAQRKAFAEARHEKQEIAMAGYFALGILGFATWLWFSEPAFQSNPWYGHFGVARVFAFVGRWLLLGPLRSLLVLTRRTLKAIVYTVFLGAVAYGLYLLLY